MAMSNKILVIGAINIDLTITPSASYQLHDSNIVSIDQTIGGVGANIAFDLDSQGCDVTMITLLSDGPFFDAILTEFATTNIRLDRSIIKPHLKANMYLSILDPKRDLYLGLNDMSALDTLTLDDFKSKEDIIRSFSTVVLDTNLPSPIMDYLLSITDQATIFVDAVSAAKAPNILPFLDQIDVIKMNQEEYQILSTLGFEPASYPNLISIVTDHENPISIYKGHDIITIQPPKVETIVSTSGAGDALLSGVIHGYTTTNDIIKAINQGIRLAQEVLQLPNSSLRK